MTHKYSPISHLMNERVSWRIAPELAGMLDVTILDQLVCCLTRKRISSFAETEQKILSACMSQQQMNANPDIALNDNSVIDHCI